MASNHSHIEQMAAANTYSDVDHAIKSLGSIDMEMENAAVAETPSGRLARLAKVYGGVKPLLTVISALPIIPASWRAAVTLFMSTIEAVLVVAPQLGAATGDGTVKIDDPKPDPVFKAGKDLEK